MMCGRFTLPDTARIARDPIMAEPAPLLQLGIRYNIPPTQQVPVVRMDQGKRQLTTIHRGLIPTWAKVRGLFVRG